MNNQSPKYIVMKNQSGLPCRWIVTDELETMYEVVCERDKSYITHVSKNKISFVYAFARRDNVNLVSFVDTNTAHCDRTIDTSNKNGNFAFTSLGLVIALEC